MTTARVIQSSEPGARGIRPALPRWRAVLVEQMRATGFLLRRPAQIAVALGALATISIALRIASRGLAFDLDAEPSPVYGLVGALLPIAVWARDERFGSSFLWTLPVDRRRHALTKVLAGWVWLMSGVALSILWLVAITLAAGGRVFPTETLHVLGSPLPLSGAVDLSALRTVTWAPTLMMGAVPFTAATATYLLASALWLGSRHPLRWVIGTVLSFAIASAASHFASSQLGMGSLAEAPELALKWLVEAPYGFDALLTARTATLDAGLSLPTGQRVSVWSAVPDMAYWRVATAIWTSAGLVALWCAASRHREQRRA